MSELVVNILSYLLKPYLNWWFEKKRTDPEKVIDQAKAFQSVLKTYKLLRTLNTQGNDNAVDDRSANNYLRESIKTISLDGPLSLVLDSYTEDGSLTQIPELEWLYISRLAIFFMGAFYALFPTGFILLVCKIVLSIHYCNPDDESNNSELLRFAYIASVYIYFIVWMFFFLGALFLRYELRKKFPSVRVPSPATAPNDFESAPRQAIQHRAVRGR